MNKLLLIDGNSIINRAYYAMPNLTSSSGVCTGGIFGFLKMFSKVIKEEQPTHVACAFDLKAPTFRHKEYPDYKAGRHPMPEELVQQIPILKELLKSMGVATFELAGYEADDILGTLSKEFTGKCVIVSGDRDLLQLASDDCTVFHTKKGITDVIKYTPELLKSEGIDKPMYITDLKGLMGDSSDNLKGVQGVGKVTATNLISQYGCLDNLYSHIDEIKGKLQEKLILCKEDAYTSKRLATIYREVPLSYTVDDLIFNYTLSQDSYRRMIELDFKKPEDMFVFESLNSSIENQAEILIIESEQRLSEELEKCKQTKSLFFTIDDVCSFTVDGKVECILKEKEDLLTQTVSQDRFCEIISPYLVDNSVSIKVFDLKSLYYVFKPFNLIFEADDLLLLSYTSDVSKHKTDLKSLLNSYAKNVETPSCAALELFNELKTKSVAENSYKVYTDIEIPLVKVLFDMENTGFKIDVEIIEKLGKTYSERLTKLENSIFELAGTRFNINSPKQLGEVLFDKLGLPSGKKKSTNADVLKRLYLIHPIIPLILEYRKVSKLQSTYIVGLTKLLDKDNRLHTVFKQALTTTGRLSSTEPNLQNIPVRTSEGKEIRKAFISSKNNRLVVADYSQIELRLMAHMSNDAQMIKDFLSDKDIHTSTAAAVFGVDIDDVTKDMRRKAKAVNFGIIYGISDFGLSEDVGCSVLEARSFMQKYFENYPSVKDYMDKTVESARKNGYVETLFGRRRVIPELKSPVYTVRTFGERAAMNMPLQGTASDIIKIAMVNVYNDLKKIEGAKLILQVHDELIIDCPADKTDEVVKIVKNAMENVIKLKVPLFAEVGIGDNWLEAKD